VSFVILCMYNRWHARIYRRCPWSYRRPRTPRMCTKMASAEQVGLNKTWELSLYELHRTPQDAITDNTEIAVSPRSLHSELMCPICLDMLKKTMTTKECLHRFCSDCIITALRSGNKVCVYNSEIILTTLRIIPSHIFCNLNYLHVNLFV